jgi:hypothetical protein
MGSVIEINDTLRISKAQGFPAELMLERHLKEPYRLEDLSGQRFEFHAKPAVRVYKLPPVRKFLVEDHDGKWVYWGLCHVLEVHHDYVGRTTSGVFTITHLNNPEEMRQAFALVDRVWENDWFNQTPGA